MRVDGFSGQGPASNNMGLSFLLPVVGYRDVTPTVASIIAQNLAEYEILILRNGISDLAEATVITEWKNAQQSHMPYPLREILIRKLGKGAALNIGLQAAAYDIVCIIDADCILDPLAAERLLRHFSDTHVAAAGGRLQVAKVAEGRFYLSSADDSRTVPAVTSRTPLLPIQQYEYMRAFRVIRPIYAFMNAQCLISGAFGMFRKKYLLKLGGYDVNSVGEDMELILRIQEKCHREGIRMVYDHTAVCKTEVPQTLARLMRQRDRWQRGLLDSLLKHWKMIGNPWYGLLGLLVLPYQVLFELLGPVIILAYLLSSEFREAVTGAWGVCILYALLEAGITFYAAYLEEHRDTRQFIREMPKLILLGIEDAVLQIILAFVRVYAIVTYWWRKTEW